MKVILWTGGNAPDRNAKLTVTITEGPASMRFCAYWEPGYCGCEDCRGAIVVGFGPTEAAAVENYWQEWEDNQ